MGVREKVIFAFVFILVPVICYYWLKKSDQWNYSGEDIIWIAVFSYFWSFFNIFVHECGHALTAHGFSYSSKISVGVGPKLFSFGEGKINFQIFPFYGFTSHSTPFATNKIRVVILAMGVITQFIFLGLVYWLLKRNKKWQKNIIGHFCYHYAIKIAFWLTFVLNFPFVLPNSDWTKITKILLSWK
ncbi:MAG: hypothetical protein MRERV_5c080 [Mycoplasmataceae bacterium RV_VA103A]|nr:MAG: hypothetical protein MRERV_5c080 [Mycoplasmataceae bacterium RV_VA103A]